MPSLSGAGKGAASGAGTGAAFGSFLPGIGTGIGAGIGAAIGGIAGFFGGGKKKKKAEPDDQTAAINKQLTNRAGQLQGRADVQMEEGQNALNTSLNYYQDILGNDAGAALEATKAERGRVVDQYDSARQAIAEFGPKGGGQTSAMAASRIAQANQLSDIGSNLKAQAAGATADIGATIAGLGMTQEQVASADLNTVLDALLAQQGLDVQKSGQKASLWGDIASVGGSILGDWLGSRGKAA